MGAHDTEPRNIVVVVAVGAAFIITRRDLNRIYDSFFPSRLSKSIASANYDESVVSRRSEKMFEITKTDNKLSS